jgi:hypothetical protein
MAEILLSPGSFLRLGKASELTLETTGTREIRARLQRGEALVEVLDAGAALTMEQNGVTAIVRNPGLYEFNQKRSMIAVYAGQALLNKDDQQLVATAGLGVGTRRFRVFRTSPDPATLSSHGAGAVLNNLAAKADYPRRKIAAPPDRAAPGGFGIHGRLLTLFSQLRDL